MDDSQTHSLVTTHHHAWVLHCQYLSCQAMPTLTIQEIISPIGASIMPMNNCLDGQTDKPTDRQTDAQAHRQTDSKTDRQTGRQADRQTDRQTNRQTARLT